MELAEELTFLTKNVESLYTYINELENDMKYFEITTYKRYKDHILIYNFSTNDSKIIDYNFINYNNVIYIYGNVLWFNDNKLYKLDDSNEKLIKEFGSKIITLHQYYAGYRILTDNGEIWDNDTFICKQDDVSSIAFDSIFVIINYIYYEIIDEKLVETNKDSELIELICSNSSNSR